LITDKNTSKANGDSGPKFVSRLGIFILLIFVHKKEPKRLRFLKISS